MAADGGDRTQPADPPEHRSISQHGPLLDRQALQPGSDDGLHRRWSREQLLAWADLGPRLVAQHACVLLGKQGGSARPPPRPPPAPPPAWLPPRKKGGPPPPAPPPPRRPQGAAREPRAASPAGWPS